MSTNSKSAGRSLRVQTDFEAGAVSNALPVITFSFDEPSTSTSGATAFGDMDYGLGIDTGDDLALDWGLGVDLNPDQNVSFGLNNVNNFNGGGGGFNDPTTNMNPLDINMDLLAPGFSQSYLPFTSPQEEQFPSPSFLPSDQPLLSPSFQASFATLGINGGGPPTPVAPSPLLNNGYADLESLGYSHMQSNTPLPQTPLYSPFQQQSTVDDILAFNMLMPNSPFPNSPFQSASPLDLQLDAFISNSLEMPAPSFISNGLEMPAPSFPPQPSPLYTTAKMTSLSFLNVPDHARPTRPLSPLNNNKPSQPILCPFTDTCANLPAFSNQADLKAHTLEVHRQQLVGTSASQLQKKRSTQSLQGQKQQQQQYLQPIPSGYGRVRRSSGASDAGSVISGYSGYSSCSGYSGASGDEDEGEESNKGQSSGGAGPSTASAVASSQNTLKPHVCTYPGCNRSFNQPAGLTSHTYTVARPVDVFHTGEKRFSCDYPDCGKSYTTKNRLKIHIRGHTGELPFQCDVPGCGYRAKQASSMKDHSVVHMNAAERAEFKAQRQKTIVCSVCLNKYRTVESLQTHSFRVHGHSAAVKASEFQGEE
ncbi:hypothetical protein CcCBS67573_g05579 [Chytriomyces confervae]|uniref:C2H2-type domain-containing protein n=1 Tax=Chytriomyces confervae TaxID=246404 RepID=A0A507FAH8_9FUNG|nr:hypothetical protein CcCBS67573_g05579 [Chytriomyces confervae]